MARVFATALTAVTMLFFGIIGLSYANTDLQAQGLANENAEALNLTTNVSTDLTTVMGHAMPWLFIIVLLAVIAVMLLIINQS